MYNCWSHLTITCRVQVYVIFLSHTISRYCTSWNISLCRDKSQNNSPLSSSVKTKLIASVVIKKNGSKVGVVIKYTSTCHFWTEIQAGHHVHVQDVKYDDDISTWHININRTPANYLWQNSRPFPYPKPKL